MRLGGQHRRSGTWRSVALALLCVGVGWVALTAVEATESIRDAVAQAKEYVTEAIRRSFPIGQGHGPLNHFYKLWG